MVNQKKLDELNCTEETYTKKYMSVKIVQLRLEGLREEDKEIIKDTIWKIVNDKLPKSVSNKVKVLFIDTNLQAIAYIYHRRKTI